MYKLFVDIFLLFFTIFLIDIPFENPIGRSWGGTSNKNQVINLDNGQDISNINPVVSKKSRFKCCSDNQSEHHNLDNGQDPSNINLVVSKKSRFKCSSDNQCRP